MRARIEMELEDTPGQLVKVLKPVSRYGANIQNVVHKREEMTPLGRVPVTVIFEVKQEGRLQKILDEVKEAGAKITRVGEEEAAVRAVVLLVGDIIGTDVRDSLDRINSIKGAKVSDLNLAIGESDEEHSARVIIWATDKEKLQSAVLKLKEIAEEKNLLVIDPMG
ncbi:hypothetical protein AKJ40_01465 [candidate division MSBL1 archaeon SCGC-AAA259M10]|uniref:ACT domain-containing protein n=2 Tax=candidate division MSBL1 TaxID=215777 RepID=A0A133V1K0_9EURY|nr:hypothetical protein AKJ66_01360 [candidate division MSBL1 archaeon SCGC-AAA259E22]KXB00330.1 hypothetical protein AKJ40_01465 [candidate division MSBL1 archaeon SCGC-AAA259M10]